jgi:hypothetical protein
MCIMHSTLRDAMTPYRERYDGFFYSISNLIFLKEKSLYRRLDNGHRGSKKRLTDKKYR